MGHLPPGYVYREFPKSKYHPDGRATTVFDAGAELALGPGWADRQFPPAPEPVDVPPPKRRGRPPKERPA